MKTIVLLLVISLPVLSGEVSITVRPDYSGLTITRDGSYQRIELPGTYYLGNEGEPDLPYYPARVAIPAGTRVVDAELVNCVYDVLPSAYRIKPVQWLICGASQFDGLPEPDGEIYGSSSFYPDMNIEQWSTGVLWGCPLFVCWLRPMQWNPSTGEIRVLTSAELEITIENDPNGPPVRARTSWSEENSRKIIRSLVVNPEAVSNSGAFIVQPGQLEYGQYVIVTVPEYESAMQELADWKTSKGIPAEIYTTDWISSEYPCIDLQQSIRAFLTDCISEGSDFVLLAGDNDVLEARFTWPGTVSLEPLPSDLYFADINDSLPGADSWDSNLNGLWGEPEDDVDWHPDLWVGRASVNSLEEAETFVQKVLTYEHVIADSLTPASDWETSIGYTTGYMTPGGGSWPGSAYAESISVMVPSFWDESKYYESMGNNSTAITIAMINEGQGNIFHANHGAPTCMYTAYEDLFTVDDIMELQNMTNTGAVTIWNSIACSLGSFDTLTCCADAWLNAPDGGGFGAFNARATYASISMSICEGFYHVYLNEDFPCLGIAHGMSLDRLCPPANGAFILMNNLFGDPELPLWISPEGPLQVEHPAAVDGSGEIALRVTDQNGQGVDNARVCLQQGDWKTGPVYEVRYTDPSGNTAIWVDPDLPGEIYVTAWAHDYDSCSGVITTGYSIPPDENLLFQVRSNPSSAPVIFLAFGVSTPVDLCIYDVSGRMVSRPIDEILDEGSHELLMEDLRPGLYFARMQAGGQTLVRQLVVISGN